MNVALAHDYFLQSGGGERVVAELHGMFPGAPIYTTVVNRRTLWAELQDAEFEETWMRYLPSIYHSYRKYFVLYPMAMRSHKLAPTDLLISSSSAVGFHVTVPPGVPHICYCHTPMRFAWAVDQYLRKEALPEWQKDLIRFAAPFLQRLDRRAAGSVTHFLANSSAVRERIQRSYARVADVIPPPVNVDRFKPTRSVAPDGFFLVVSRLVAYKRIDLAIQAAIVGRFPLVIIGDGPARSQLQRLAQGNPAIRFLGHVDERVLTQYLQSCGALIFPGEEDFGIAPIEANAAGRPVVAYAEGGSLDTIHPGVNGVFFARQTVNDLLEACEQARVTKWDSHVISFSSDQYSPQSFRRRVDEVVQRWAF